MSFPSSLGIHERRRLHHCSCVYDGLGEKENVENVEVLACDFAVHFILSSLIALSETFLCPAVSVHI